jgi:hypothetical protein
MEVQLVAATMASQAMALIVKISTSVAALCATPMQLVTTQSDHIIAPATKVTLETEQLA